MSNPLFSNLLFARFQYFFYGACTEDMLPGLIMSAEAKGCEFIQCMTETVKIASQGGLVMIKGQPETQIVVLYRVLVRCDKKDFDRIKAEMMEDAKKEQAEGLRGGLQK